MHPSLAAAWAAHHYYPSSSSTTLSSTSTTAINTNIFDTVGQPHQGVINYSHNDSTPSFAGGGYSLDHQHQQREYDARVAQQTTPHYNPPLYQPQQLSHNYPSSATTNFHNSIGSATTNAMPSIQEAAVSYLAERQQRSYQQHPFSLAAPSSSSFLASDLFQRTNTSPHPQGQTGSPWPSTSLSTNDRDAAADAVIGQSPYNNVASQSQNQQLWAYYNSALQQQQQHQQQAVDPNNLTQPRPSPLLNSPWNNNNTATPSQTAITENNTLQPNATFPASLPHRPGSHRHTNEINTSHQQHQQSRGEHNLLSGYREQPHTAFLPTGSGIGSSGAYALLPQQPQANSFCRQSSVSSTNIESSSINKKRSLSPGSSFVGNGKKNRPCCSSPSAAAQQTTQQQQQPQNNDTPKALNGASQNLQRLNEPTTISSAPISDAMKQKIRSHKIFPIVSMFQKRCDMALATGDRWNEKQILDWPEMRHFLSRCEVTPNNDEDKNETPSQKSNNKRKKKSKSNDSGDNSDSDDEATDPETQQITKLLTETASVMRLHLFELEKVDELCQDFCDRYQKCLRAKYKPEQLVEELGASDYYYGGNISNVNNAAANPYAYFAGGSNGVNNNNASAYAYASQSGSIPHQNSLPSSYYGNCSTGYEQAAYRSYAHQLHARQQQHQQWPATIDPTFAAAAAAAAAAGYGQPSNLAYGIMPSNCTSAAAVAAAHAHAAAAAAAVLFDERGGLNLSGLMGCGGLGGGGAGGVRGALPKQAVSMMKAWLFANVHHPYPSEDEKREFADKCNLSLMQINNWFINARRRILQPMVGGSNSGNNNNHMMNSNSSSDGHSTNGTSPPQAMMPIMQ